MSQGNLNIPADQWLRELFEYEFCPECGGDAEHHTALPVFGNWFAKCRYPADEETGAYHPVIARYRRDMGCEEVKFREHPDGVTEILDHQKGQTSVYDIQGKDEYL